VKYTLRTPDETVAVEIEADTYQAAVDILADNLTPGEATKLYRREEDGATLQRTIDARVQEHPWLDEVFNSPKGVELRERIFEAKRNGASDFEVGGILNEAEMRGYRKASFAGEWGK